MHTVQLVRRLALAAGLLVLAGCQDNITAPRRPAPLRPPYAAAQSGTWINGNVITATGDDGTTISVDRGSHTISFNGQSLIFTQEAADSVANLFLRMYNAEQAAEAALSAPPPQPSLCDDPSAPCDLGHSVMQGGELEAGQPRTAGGKLTRKGIVTEPLVVGSTMDTESLSSVMGYDPNFTCTQISQAIYDEMPNYRAAKSAVIAGLLAEGARLLTVVKALPQFPANPTSWYGWADLYLQGPMLDYLYVNFERSRFQLNFFATLFRIQNCYTPPSSPAPAPAPGSGGGNGGGGSGGKTCYWEVTWIPLTGQIIDMRFLGCW